MPAVELVRAWPGRWESTRLEVADGSTVEDALACAGVSLPADGFVAVAVHGVVARLQQVLEEGDRIELLRPLVADPKENRRRRARGGQ